MTRPPTGRAPLRQRTMPAAVLATLPLAACLLVRDAVIPVAFSHAVHVGGQGLQCGICHGAAKLRDHAGMPPPELCAPCHDELARTRPDLRPIAEFYDERPRYRRRQVAALPSEVRFSHRHHDAAGVACDQCHGAIAGSAGIPAPAVAKDDCLSCHRQRGVADACQTCHADVDRDWRPPSHDGLWPLRHGEVARRSPVSSAERCELCHDETRSCLACHRTNEPSDHDEYFRLRGHGLAAAFDRARCATCHQRDSCARCHEQVRPASHTANFGGSSGNHCIACHFPLRSSGCATCHKDAPSHRLATPLPPDHDPAMNCRACHGAGVRLPHQDGGHACVQCHR